MGVSPSLLVYGEQLAIPGLLVSPPLTYDEACLTTFTTQLTSDLRLLREFVLQHDETLKGPSGDDCHPPKNWDKYSRVWLKDPIFKGSFAPKYLGPYEVQDKEYPVLTLIRDGKPYRVNVDRVKPCFTLGDLEGYRNEVTQEEDVTVQPVNKKSVVISLPISAEETGPRHGSNPNRNSQGGYDYDGARRH